MHILQLNYPNWDKYTKAGACCAGPVHQVQCNQLFGKAEKCHSFHFWATSSVAAATDDPSAYIELVSLSFFVFGFQRTTNRVPDEMEYWHVVTGERLAFDSGPPLVLDLQVCGKSRKM